MQSKVPMGQRLPPWIAHGRQDNPSTPKDRSEGPSGPKPNAGTVAPKIAKVVRSHGSRQMHRGAVVGDDECACAKKFGRLPEREFARHVPHRRTLSAPRQRSRSQRGRSSLPPISTMLQPAWLSPMARDVKCRAGHRLVNHTDPGASATTRCTIRMSSCLLPDAIHGGRIAGRRRQARRRLPRASMPMGPRSARFRSTSWADGSYDTRSVNNSAPALVVKPTRRGMPAHHTASALRSDRCGTMAVSTWKDRSTATSRKNPATPRSLPFLSYTITSSIDGCPCRT